MGFWSCRALPRVPYHALKLTPGPCAKGTVGPEEFIILLSQILNAAMVSCSLNIRHREIENYI